jgi:hypothetical protein
MRTVLIGVLGLGALAFGQSVGFSGPPVAGPLTPAPVSPGPPISPPAPANPGLAPLRPTPGGPPISPPVPANPGLAPLRPIPPTGFGPRVRPFGRGHGGRGGFGEGAAVVPYPIYGYGSGFVVVHNPPPGVYDPIFGVYNPGPLDAQPYQQQAPQSPAVVINQDFQPEVVHPQVRDYSNVALPQPAGQPEPGGQPAPPGPPAISPQPQPGAPPPADDQQATYLIAMRDRTIYLAIAYWVQGDTLNYVTVDGKQNRVSLSLVDRDLSRQLNRERNVPFRLPAQ